MKSRGSGQNAQDGWKGGHLLGAPRKPCLCAGEEAEDHKRRNGRSLRQFRPGSWKKVKSKKDVILEAQRDKKESPLWYTDRHMSPQKCGVGTQITEVQRSIVLRGDIVKDDSGACAVFTEQGSSASQMTAAKVMDVIPRLPDCDGQAADAISGYTQVKMEDAPRLLKILEAECPDLWIRLPRHKWPKS